MKTPNLTIKYINCSSIWKLKFERVVDHCPIFTQRDGLAASLQVPDLGLGQNTDYPD
jgi:hypothetical protein